MTRNDEREKRSGVSPDHPVARIEDDHSSVRDRLAQIAAAKSCSALLSALSALPQQLEEHFALEESDKGFFEDIGRRKPALVPQLDLLRDDHRAILEQAQDLCRQLRDRVEADTPDEEIPPHLLSAVTHWSQQLQRHEHDESSMIIDVYYSDEGGYG